MTDEEFEKLLRWLSVTPQEGSKVERTKRTDGKWFFGLLVLAVVVYGLLAFVASKAEAQTIARDAAKVTWLAPTQCTTGEAITSCPVTGYRLEKQSGTTWAMVTTVGATVLTYLHTGLPVGPATYRVIALSAGGESAASNVAVKVIPAAIPSAPVMIDPVAYEIRGTPPVASRVGLVTYGAPCPQGATQTIGTVTYTKIPGDMVDTVNWPGGPKRDNYWAKCG